MLFESLLCDLYDRFPAGVPPVKCDEKVVHSETK